MSNDDYTTPADFPAGALARATLNAQVPQNILALKNAIMGDAQATGEVIQRIYVGTNAAIAALTPTAPGGRMARATDDPKCLWLDNGTAWEIMGGQVPHCRVYKSSDMTTNTATATPISFSNARVNNDAMWVIGAPTMITLTHAGTYDLGCTAQWNASAAGTRRYTAIRLVTGSVVLALVQDAPVAATFNLVQNVNTQYTFTAGQQVEMVCYQDTGGTLGVGSAANYSPEFWATFKAA